MVLYNYLYRDDRLSVTKPVVYTPWIGQPQAYLEIIPVVFNYDQVLLWNNQIYTVEPIFDFWKWSPCNLEPEYVEGINIANGQGKFYHNLSINKDIIREQIPLSSNSMTLLSPVHLNKDKNSSNQTLNFSNLNWDLPKSPISNTTCSPMNFWSQKQGEQRPDKEPHTSWKVWDKNISKSMKSGLSYLPQLNDNQILNSEKATIHESHSPFSLSRRAQKFSCRLDVVKKTIFRKLKKHFIHTFAHYLKCEAERPGYVEGKYTIVDIAINFITKNYVSTRDTTEAMFFLAMIDVK